MDPIKVAEGRYLADASTIHYGLIPRTNRGIFTINELPDLAERIQVGLLNILEERDVQVRGYTLRLPLDLFVVASANPEDYTSRGRIITPLKDRLGSQIRTHYPRTIDGRDRDHAARSARRFAGDRDAGSSTSRASCSSSWPSSRTWPRALAGDQPALRRQRAREHRQPRGPHRERPQARRAAGEPTGSPRVSDLGALSASTTGKIELETLGDESPEERVVDRLLTRALHNVFARHVDIDDLDELVEAFESGLTHRDRRARAVARVRALDARGARPRRRRRSRLGGSGSAAAIASAVEFLLEGLHLNRRLNKERGSGWEAAPLPGHERAARARRPHVGLLRATGSVSVRALGRHASACPTSRRTRCSTRSPTT